MPALCTQILHYSGSDLVKSFQVVACIFLGAKTENETEIISMSN